MVRQIGPASVHVSDLDLGVVVQINQGGRVARVGLFVVLSVHRAGRVLPAVDHDAEATVDRLVHVGDLERKIPQNSTTNPQFTPKYQPHLSIHKVQSGVVHGQQAALAQLEHAGAGQGVPVGLVGRVPQPARVIGGAVFVDVRVVLDQVQGRHARGWSGFAHQATNSLNWGLTGFLRKRRN